MQMIVNLNVAVERELELEQGGQSRTRRWIGDIPRDADPGWHKPKMRQVPAPVYRQNGSSQIEMGGSRSGLAISFLNRFFQMPSLRRQAVKSEA